MVSSQKFLAKCSALVEKKIYFEMEQGQTVARGFADLGFEEFTLLNAHKIVSLYSGKVSDLPEDDRKHFFPVPAVDDLVDRIVKSGLDITRLNFLDQRKWVLTVSSSEGHERQYAGQTLKDVLLNCLLESDDV